ncbi:acetyl-CoA carboxylase biotin carboxyl carrier protein [Streptomyces sp. 8N706]|uniref:acetyl-CoA carboxylase biotin carboxyl carrier protein n=1 Tax=Streptomyces sp. 8N706 TaxID=3457416 RepID=UPI003FD53F66
MTPHPNTTEHRENGRRPALGGNGFTATDLTPLGHADLDSVCRSVMELARTAPRPPLRIRLQHGQMTVEMEWPDSVAGSGTRTEQPVHQPRTPSAGPPPAAQDEVRYLLAPTVGTFYHAPEPGAPPFVSVGDVVRPGQPVGILEVMKMMSTVEADAAGRVVEFLAPDAQPVQFQQRLLALEPLHDAEA